MVRCVCHHAAYFHIHVLPWALSGASREIEFRECAALLLPPTLLSQQVAAKVKGMGKNEGVSGCCVRVNEHVCRRSH